MQRTWLSDPDLVAALKAGQEQAFNQLFRQHFTGMSMYAFTIVHDKQQAEDLVQDCLESLWKRRAALPEVRSIKAYLYKTVFFICLKHVERRRTHPLPSSGALSSTILENITLAETASQLYQLLDTLPTSQRQVVKLYYLEERTTSEIAQMLHITPDAVRKQRIRALVSLRKSIIPLS